MNQPQKEANFKSDIFPLLIAMKDKIQVSLNKSSNEKQELSTEVLQLKSELELQKQKQEQRLEKNAADLKDAHERQVAEMETQIASLEAQVQSEIKQINEIEVQTANSHTEADEIAFAMEEVQKIAEQETQNFKRLYSEMKGKIATKVIQQYDSDVKKLLKEQFIDNAERYLKYHKDHF